MTDGIHQEHPFAAPAKERDPVRRFRGRLAGGVTVLTTGEGEQRVGITVTSVMMVEGNPPRALALVNEASDFWELLEDRETYVMHILTASDRHLSEEFAGLRPAPGGAFAAHPTTPTKWGPVLDEVSNRAFCRVERAETIANLVLVVATIDRIELDELSEPLLYFRGAYRRLTRDR